MNATEQFVKYPVWLQAMRLPALYKELWLLISRETYHHPTRRSRVRLTLDLIAEKVAASRATIHRALKAMRDMGLIGVFLRRFRPCDYWTLKPGESPASHRETPASQKDSTSIDASLEDDHRPALPDKPVEVQPPAYAPDDDLVNEMVTMGFGRRDAIATARKQPMDYLRTVIGYVRSRGDQIRNAVGYVKDAAHRGNYQCPTPQVAPTPVSHSVAKSGCPNASHPSHREAWCPFCQKLKESHEQPS